MISTQENIQPTFTTIEAQGLDATDSGVRDAVGGVASSVIKGIGKGIHRTIGDTPETTARIEQLYQEINLQRKNNVDLFAQVTAAQSTNSTLIAMNMELVQAHRDLSEKYHLLLAEHADCKIKMLNLPAPATLKRK